MDWNWLGRPFMRKPKKKKALEQVVQQMVQQAEAWETLLRSIRLAVILTMPLFGVGTCAAGVFVGISNLELPVALEIICDNEADLLNSEKSAFGIADEILRRIHPELKGVGVEDLDSDLKEERLFYYQLVKQCRNMK